MCVREREGTSASGERENKCLERAFSFFLLSPSLTFFAGVGEVAPGAAGGGSPAMVGASARVVGMEMVGG